MNEYKGNLYKGNKGEVTPMGCLFNFCTGDTSSTCTGNACNINDQSGCFFHSCGYKMKN